MALRHFILAAVFITMMFAAIPDSYAAGHTFQLTLRLSDTQSEVYVPGTGAMPSASITNRTYTPTHWFIASYLSNALKALVFAGADPASIKANRTTYSHYITLSQGLDGSKTLLAFTSGDWKAVSNRMDMIEAGSFLAQPFPSFAYGLGAANVIKIMLGYADVDILNDLMLGKGRHPMRIENAGASGRKIMLSITS